MKITYFEAENMAGIKVGTKKKKISIDFSKNKNKLVLLLGGNGSGKAQPNSSIVYTPKGPKKIGDIQIGDKVFDYLGNVVEVDGVFPKGKLDVYKVEFSDGKYMYCNDDHLFSVYSLENDFNYIMSVKEIMTEMKYKDSVFSIPMCSTDINFEYDENNILMDSKEGRIRKLDKYFNVFARINSKGNIQLPFFSEGIEFLVESLGGVYIKETNEVFLQYDTKEKLFITKNNDKYIYKAPYRNITKITKRDIQVEMTCIHLNNINHLYLTNNFIVTHNTSLLSVLHPLRSTNDDRSTVFEGEKAYKEIHIEDNGNEYIIKHTWKPNKSFISKNGEELNENGNITSFNEIIEEELGINKDYFKIGRLGSNVTNFIGLKSADRKKYISNFLPYIDDYLKLYDIVNNKFSLLNKELKNISSQLDKFPEKDILEEKINNFDNTLTSLEKVIENLNKQKAVNEFSLSQLLEKFNNEGIDLEDNKLISKYESKVNASKNDFDKSKSIIETFTTKYNKLAEYTDEDIITTMEECKNKVNDYEKLSIKNKTEISNYNQTISDLQKRISVLKLKINENVTKELEEVNNELEKLNMEHESILERKSKLDPEIFNYSTKEYNDTIKKANIICNMIIENIISIFNFESYNLDEIDRYEDYKVEIENLLLEKKELDDKIVYIENSMSKLEILKKKPSNCNNETCSFIMDSIKFRDKYYSKLNDYIEEADILNEKITMLSENIEHIEEMKSFIKECNNIIPKINSLRKSFLPNFFFDKDFNLQTFLALLNTGAINIEKVFDVSAINLAITLSKEEEINNLKIDSYNKQKENLLVQAENLDSYKNEINQLTSQLETIMNKLSDINIEQEKINKNIKMNNTKINILKELKEARKTFSEMNEVLDEAVNTLNIIKENKTNLDTIKDNIQNLNVNLSEQTKLKKSNEAEKSKVVKDLNYLEILLENKEDLDKKYSDTKEVKDALDPKKGIPLLFIEQFLESITEKTNELLELAYGSSFRISFDLTEKDFFIKVDQTFSTLDDISLASQGEVSMTTLSLSLAMIENMIKKYNIIYLDEIDATLSTENRRVFLNMLEKQLEDLDIEQIFIISHNQEFYSYPVDLILFNDCDVNLNDKEFMSNKNVLYNIYDDKEE